jgi:5-methylcytosine-specific restriction protein A
MPNRAKTLSQIKHPTPRPDNRPSAWKRGYNGRWKRIRHNHLAKEPLCRECKAMNKITSATVVDHIIPHKGDKKLFYDPNNRQSLCKFHHDSKTAREDGGYGNRIRA